jgi:hypothetical protein
MAQGREALRLPRVLLSLSPRSVLAMQFDQLYVDRPTLNVRRAADGKWSIAGLDPAWGAQADDRVLDRLFSQPEFVIRHGAVVWTDELRGEAPLALRDLDLVLRNQGRRHDLRLDATPPPEWGDRFGLVARMEQPFLSMDNGRWREWSGQVFANFSRVDVSRLQRHADLGVDLTAGPGCGARLGRRAPRCGHRRDRRPGPGRRGDPPRRRRCSRCRLAALSGGWLATGRIAGDTVEFGTQGLAFDTAEGQRWPGGNFQLVQTAANASRAGPRGADGRPAGPCGPGPDREPAAARAGGARGAGAACAAAAWCRRLKARWTGPAEAIEKFNVQGRVEQLAVQALPKESAQAAAGHAVGTPGIRGATVDFDLTESSGKATVLVQEGAVDLPGVFEEPVVPITRLSADLSWQRNGDRSWPCRCRRCALPMRMPRASCSSSGRPATRSVPARAPAIRVCWTCRASSHAAWGRGSTATCRWCCTRTVRDYVRDAVQGGSSPSVVFKVRGDLWDMPFVNPKQGEFSIVASIRDGVLAYVPRSLPERGRAALAGADAALGGPGVRSPVPAGPWRPGCLAGATRRCRSRGRR